MVDRDVYDLARNVGRAVVWFDREMGESLAGEALLEAAAVHDGRDYAEQWRALVVLFVRRRCVDYVRAELGRSGRRAPVRVPVTLETVVARSELDGAEVTLGVGPAVGEHDSGFGWAELEVALAQVGRRLSADERWVVAARANGWTLLAIAELWGVTEGRVCQISSAARVKMERHLWG